MTSSEHLEREGHDDPATVLAAARMAHLDLEAAAVRELVAAVEWAAMHSADSVTAEDWLGGCEATVPVAGVGAPEVAEFCVAEFALAVGRSVDSGRIFLGEALEIRYRLPRLWEQVTAGRVPVWRALLVARRTIPLSPEAAAFVDQGVALFANGVGPVQLDRLVTEAVLRHDPVKAEEERRKAADQRRVDIHLPQTDTAGLVHFEGEVDLADARDLEEALRAGAQQLKAAGSVESLDVRRTKALGLLARGQGALELRREVVWHVHTSPGSPVARVEGFGPLALEAVKGLVGPDTKVTVKPVIDLNGHISVEAYEVPDRLAEQMRLRDLTCVHPRCHRRARRCDCDHVNPYNKGGPTCSCNLAPLCRRHHRLKTHGGWRYRMLHPGTYLWRSPEGHLYLRDPTGSYDLTWQSAEP